MASTAAGHAYAAALDENVGDALLAEMEREIPDGAKLLRPRLESNRHSCVKTVMSSPAACGARISTAWPSRYGRRNIRHSSWSRSVCWRRCMTKSGCTRRLHLEFSN